jgi:hypothetical protein
MHKHPDYDKAMMALENEFCPPPPQVRRIYNTDDPDSWVDIEITPVPGRMYFQSDGLDYEIVERVRYASVKEKT